ncbi:MAG TPA: hypothetical protein VHA33_13905 [Candidatus Angelobacter sp.]|jgi:hypothetical protein|nr:hypothetical protein [Candidatus Angelobacter sp.]
MEIDKEAYKKIILLMAENLKTAEREILSYFIVFKALAHQHHLDDEGLEALLNAARTSAVVESQLKKKYDDSLPRMLEQIDRVESYQEALKTLQQWKPRGPIN